MALVTIVAKNQTGSVIPLSQLYAPNGEIPQSGQVTLTDYNRVEQILDDDELLSYIQNDQILLNVAALDLTKEQSLSFLDAPTVPVKVSHGLSSQGPAVTDDASTGYSIGSTWITTGGAIYVCVDATPDNAVWTRTDSATPYSDIVSADTLTTTLALTPVLLDSMTITPPAGTYLVWFNADVYSNKNNTTAAVLLYSGGTEVAISERTFTFNSSNGDAMMSTQARVTVNGAQAIEGRWYVVAGSNPTLTSLDRSLMIVAVETP